MRKGSLRAIGLAVAMIALPTFFLPTQGRTILGAPIIRAGVSIPQRPRWRDLRVWRDGEMASIIDSVIRIESGGNPRALNEAEMAVGLMQIRKIARDEFNLWTGKSYNYWTMFDPVSNREAGSYILTNILYRYRCRGNIVQAVAAYNIGFEHVKRGEYPATYLERVVPWYWKCFLHERVVVDKWKNHVGVWIYRVADPSGNPPEIGL